MENKFTIVGITCKACTRLAENRLKSIEGVEQASVSLNGETVVISNKPIGQEALQKALADLNFSLLG